MKDLCTAPLVSLDLANIRDSEDGPFCMSFGYDPAMLMESLRKTGLVNPPCVLQSQDGKFCIVTGYRRIRGLKSLGVRSASCRDLTGIGFSELECLLINLMDNLATRRLNEVEKGMVLRRLLRHLDEERVIRLYMPLLGLPSHKKTLEVFLSLENVDPEIKESLARGAIGLKSVEAFLDLEPEDARKLCRLMTSLKLSISYQLQLIDYVVDISNREGLRIADLLGSLEDAPQEDRINRPQRTKRLFGHLRAMRFPRLAKAEEQFRKLVREMDLPEGVSIRHSPGFEAPGFRMEISFGEGSELADILEELSSRREALETIREPWSRGR